MVVTHEEIRRTPQNPRTRSRQTAISNQVSSQNREDPQNNGEIRNNMFSPTFKSVAEMAGWDEEALLLASLVVEDTPEREKNASNRKKRSQLLFKTPPSNSRRKRRAQRRSPAAIPVTVLNLDDDEEENNSSSKKRETEKQKKTVSKAGKIDAKKLVVEEDKQVAGESSAGAACSNSTIPDMAKLREELSCAICLEICFEPSTTPCGHSFCKKCLRSAADKCGKRCPKCRQLISNGRSCTVNTVLWNTIQLLFPKEVEARKAAGALNGRESNRQSPIVPTATRRSQQHHNNYQTRPIRSNGLSRRSVRGGDDDGFRSSNTRRIGVVANEDEDAALALRLQREEFMVENRASGRRTTNGGSSFSSARETLRAIASRASRLRNSRPM